MTSQLEFHPVVATPTPIARQVQLLQECRRLLLTEGMASIDEYGDMLKWGLPKEDGVCRNVHVFHPGFCSYDDRYRATIHYHGGAVQGTVLAGHLRHDTYRATPDPHGDRLHDGLPHRLQRHQHSHATGTTYALAAMVPHWIVPTTLTLTYFEEEDTDRMGDLIDPAERGLDDHSWTQEMADGLLPQVLQLVDGRLEQLAQVAGRTASRPRGALRLEAWKRNAPAGI